MPEHEPEVIAAARRRKPVNKQVALAFTPTLNLGQQVLCCPYCGHSCRHSEISCSSNDRVDSWHIHFLCERCGDGAAFKLVVTDHKRGAVLVEWSGAPK